MAQTTQNTACDIGVRRDFATLGARNYEVGVQYSCGREGYELAGVIYHVGDLLPFDGSGKYADDARMERDFNSGWLTPTI